VDVNGPKLQLDQHGHSNAEPVPMNSPNQPKRFYKSVSWPKVEGGYGVELDGRAIKSGGRRAVVVPSKAMAEAIGREWEQQEETIDLAAMPLTRLAQRAVDVDDTERLRLIDEIVSYGSSDLLCYRASDPRPLVLRQNEVWQPLLDWAAEDLGARLEITSGLSVLRQSQQALKAIRSCIGDLSTFEICGLSPAVSLLGSAVLGLAVFKGHLGVDEAYLASQLDELWQAEQWGSDAEAEDRRSGLKRDLASIKAFLDFL
jgi:chaperone required for assembly of F1-ATPase